MRQKTERQQEEILNKTKVASTKRLYIIDKSLVRWTKKKDRRHKLPIPRMEKGTSLQIL